MSRPAGVTVSAVLLIIGSLLSVFMSVILLFPQLLFPDVAAGTPLPESAKYSVKLSGFACLGGAFWGLFTAINLLRMRGWARVSILVLSALLLVSFVPSLLIFLAMPLLVPELASFRGSTEMAYVAFIAGVPILLGIIWLVYFSRASVKDAFLQREPPAETPSRPLSIAVIAWHAIIFGLGTLAMLFTQWPALFLGIAVARGSAVFVNLAMGAITLAIGIGLLKMKPWSHTAAVWFCIYEIAQTSVFAIMPSNVALFDALMRESDPSLYAQPVVLPMLFYWMIAGFSWATFGVALWYLFTRKKAFLEAGKVGQSPV